MNNTETIYKLSDRVWSPTFGWGVVARIDTDVTPVCVKFDIGDNIRFFTLDGRYFTEGPISLFFTEQQYSVERPAWQPKPGEHCWFWDDDSKNVVLRPFMKMESKEYYDNSGIRWDNCAPFIGELPPHLKEVQS